MHQNVVIKCSLLELMLRNWIIFYTTSFSILKNKEQRTYDVLFEEIKKNTENNNNIIITPKNFHCDFEKGISMLLKKVFPDIYIKYCI